MSGLNVTAIDDVHDNELRSYEAFPEAGVARKVMVTVWWSPAAFIHQSFSAFGEAVSVEKYCEDLHQTHQELPRIHLTLIKKMCNPTDNARSQAFFIDHNEKAQLGYEAILQRRLFERLFPYVDHFLKNIYRHFFARRVLPKAGRWKKGIRRFCCFQDSRVLGCWNVWTSFSLAEICWFFNGYFVFERVQYFKVADSKWPLFWRCPNRLDPALTN